MLRPLEKAQIDGKPVTNEILEQKLLPSPDKMMFSVESTKNFYNVPQTVFPGSIPEPTPEEKKGIITSKNIMWLKVRFTSKVCMVFEGEIILKNIDRPNDIRVYKLYQT